MKRYAWKWSAVLMALLLFGGCAPAAAEEDPTGLTQSIVVEELGPSSSSDVSLGESSEEELPQDPYEALFQTKAEKEAVELDLENLEADYRIGKLSSDEFNQQREELKQRERELDIREDQIKLSLPRQDQQALYPEVAEETDGGELYRRLDRIEVDEDALDLQEEELEKDYLAGNITREEYVQQQMEVERQKENLEIEEDVVEDRLEALGLDD